MKKSLTLLASTVCLGALAAHGTPGQGFGEIYPDFQPHTQSDLNRAAVEADLRGIRKAGTMRYESDGYDPRAALIPSTRQRQAMEAEGMGTSKAYASPAQESGYKMSAPAETPR